MFEAGALGFLDILTFAVVLGLIVSFLLPKKIHYMLNGALLLAFATFHILFDLGRTEFDVRQTPVLVFVVAFVVMVTAKELIAESIRERGAAMKGVTFIMGLVLIILVLIPELYHYGAINFDLPDYPFIINAVIYIIAGIVAIIAPFFEG